MDGESCAGNGCDVRGVCGYARQCSERASAEGCGLYSAITESGFRLGVRAEGWEKQHAGYRLGCTCAGRGQYGEAHCTAECRGRCNGVVRPCNPRDRRRSRGYAFG
ncbi:MAG: hypothetical protein E3J72_10385 [Planctomycetota bacterium]|nr:MAG: hypothetical protein E3J72_10385 [Planctomycetota bacterium]